MGYVSKANHTISITTMVDTISLIRREAEDVYVMQTSMASSKIGQVYCYNGNAIAGHIDPHDLPWAIEGSLWPAKAVEAPKIQKRASRGHTRFHLALQTANCK